MEKGDWMGGGSVQPTNNDPGGGRPGLRDGESTIPNIEAARKKRV
jgi:hypothetical protein